MSWYRGFHLSETSFADLRSHGQLHMVFLVWNMRSRCNMKHASRWFLKENLSIISIIHLNVSSSFIRPFPDDAIEHWLLNFSWRAFNSRFAAAKTMKDFIFVPSPLAAKHTLTLTFSCPVVFIKMSFLPTFSTVSSTMSAQTGASSMAIIKDRTCWCRFFRRQHVWYMIPVCQVGQMDLLLDLLSFS